MRKTIIFSICFGVAASIALNEGHAQSDAIAARQKILKSFGNTTKPVAAMLKGQAPFDLATVQTALKTIVAGTKKLPSLYPPDSKTGGKTQALLRIWEEKPRFEGLYAKLGKDAAAAETAITDEASLKANFGKVFGDCKACHDDFRQKK
jgi:cytochrome c556